MKKWECSVCGYVHEGETPPEECPVCGAESSAFVELVETSKAQDSVSESVAHTEASSEELLPQPKPGKMNALIVQLHLHPIMVHMPNGILPMAFTFLLISVVFSASTFEQAAFYSLVFTLLSMPAVVFTGFVTWKSKYKGALTSTFKMKIAASIVSMSLLFILVFWRIIAPDILSSGGKARILYVLLALTLVGTVGIAGQLGGQLIFRASRK